MSLASRVASFSAYRKTEDHVTTRTLSGAIVTIVGVLAAATLFVNACWDFNKTDVVQQMVVDRARGETLSARLNVSVLAIPCSGALRCLEIIS